MGYFTLSFLLFISLLCSSCSKPSSVVADVGRVLSDKSSVSSDIAIQPDVCGVWLMRDKSNNNSPQSIVCFYKNKSDGLFYGKMIAIFDDNSPKIIDTIQKPIERSKGIEGAPFLCGLDFLFRFAPSSNNRLLGHVIDPDNGSIFRCEVWYDQQKSSLVVRGELLIFGESMYLTRFDKKNLPFNFESANLNADLSFLKGR